MKKSLFKHLQTAGTAKTRPIADGFSLPLAITVGLILLLGGMALANRVGLSVLGSVFQGKGLVAREAAETGAERIISELNLPPNRRFLLSSSSTPSSSLWTATELASGSTLSSVCVAQSQSLTSNRQLGTTASPPSTGPYPWVYLDSSGQITTDAGDAARAYRLVAIERQPTTYYKLDKDSRDNGWSRFNLVVDGASIINGQIESQIRLDKEYQVMPKCCNTSFGGSHGKIAYTDPETGDLSQECLKSALGFGLVGGAAENNTGVVRLAGNAEANSPENEPIPVIYCVVSPEVSGDCTPTDSKNISVRNVIADMPDIPMPPTSSEATPSLSEAVSGGKKLLNASFTPASGSGKSATPAVFGGLIIDKTSCNSGSPPGSLFTAGFCDYTSGTLTIDASGAAGVPGCTSIPKGSISTNGKLAEYSEVHCLVSKLNFDSPVDILRIAVPPALGEESRKLIFYFINQDSDVSDPVVKANGNGMLMTCTTGTGSCISPPNLTDVSFLGCPNLQQPSKLYDFNGSIIPCSQSSDSAARQTVRLGGTPSLGEGGGVFIWFPNGNIDLRGTSAFTGVGWANKVSANGTVDFIVPGAGLGDVLSYSRFFDPPVEEGGSDGGGGSSFPIIDFVARATNNFKWCSVSSAASGCE